MTPGQAPVNQSIDGLLSGLAWLEHLASGGNSDAFDYWLDHIEPIEDEL